VQRSTFPSLLALAFIGGCSAGPTPPPMKPVADVKQLMASVVDPAADVIWGSVGTIVSEKGTEERAPKTDEEWAAVFNSAVIVSESGNLLMMDGRAKDNGEWIKHSRDLIDIGSRTMKAAQARDKDAIFTLGGDIYNVCADCHKTYLIETATVAPR
jgi:hypothetical protein